MCPVLKVLTIVVLAFGRQGHANELNKNNGIMFPNQPYQIVNATTNITITCVFIHNTEIQWTLPKLSTESAVGKETMRRKSRQDFSKIVSNIWIFLDGNTKQPYNLHDIFQRDPGPNACLLYADDDECQDYRHGIVQVSPDTIPWPSSGAARLRLRLVQQK